MNRNLLKLQKIREANQSLENRYLLKEQPVPPATGSSPAPVAPSTPPPPANTTQPPTKTGVPKKLSQEQEESFNKAKGSLVSCSSYKGLTDGPYKIDDSLYYYIKGDETKHINDFWCKKDD